MNSLAKRVISAVIALTLLVFTHYFFAREGLLILGGLIFGGGAYEYSKMAFTKAPGRFHVLFLSSAFILLIITISAISLSTSLWAIAATTFISCSLWSLRGKVANDQLLNTVALATLGLLYCALLPTFILRLLSLPDGLAWFALLVAVVFSGDTFAYFGGISFGKNKLMPTLSPGKTIAGAVSGLAGSAVAGVLIGHFYLSAHPLWAIVLCSILASVLAQNGDLLESLIKRVADVKDSGRIMPGHGGILDRLDGVYFAAPLIFAVADYLYRTTPILELNW